MNVLKATKLYLKMVPMVILMSHIFYQHVLNRERKACE